MKRMKKLASLLLAAIMVLSMTVTAFAADEDETYTITTTNNGHTYEVYQIFTGDLSDSDEGKVLSNVKWGVNGTGETSTAVDDETLTAIQGATGTDDERLSIILNYVNLTNPVATLTTETPFVEVAPGYYLIKDKDESVEGNDSYTTYIVEVVGDVTIAPKADVPEFEKKVDDKNDSSTVQDETIWQDSADYDIGDEVPFQLKGTVAENYDSYEEYYFAFHDVEEKGLTFNKNSVKVYVDGTEITEGFNVVTETTDGCTFEVIFSNLKTIIDVKAGSVITVEYTSTLNADATLGSAGNKNTAHLEFSNNPNANQGGISDTGKTPTDTVIVFTYKVVVNKVDENKEPLKGAGFTLYKKNAAGEYVPVGSELKGNELTTFEWKGLDDGDYKLVETTTPAGYNSIADIEFTITAEHEVESDDPRLVKLEGGNLFTGDISIGTLTASVENKAGATLPETGGIGTTIFYVVGAVLVLGAVVVMVTRKRMSGNN